MRPAKSTKQVKFKLDIRHERFCRFVMSGLSGRAAYIEAGFADTAAGAARLMKRPEIKNKLKHLREVQRRRLNVTLDGLVDNLRTGQELAIAHGNPTAYVAATMGLAKLMGFLKEDRAAEEINIFINRPLREPSKEIELTPDQWIAKWSTKTIEAKPNGHDGNGKDPH